MEVESTTWYYRFDGNGNLVEMTPNGSNPANGAIRYSYDAANQLNKIETYSSSYLTLAQMNYDGLSYRARLITWAAGVPLTTTYATRIAGQIQILQAASGSNTTSYLYGLTALGEFGPQSIYYLVDGAGSVRQLADLNGAVVLTRWYEPLGQILTQRGSSDATYGYLGAQVDRITGLLYINGAYYDPVMGRYLSPNGNGQNPYVPFAALSLAPFIVLALLRRKKKGQLWTGWLVIAVMASVGLGIAACGGGSTPVPVTPPHIPNPLTPRPIVSVTPTPSPTAPPPSPLPTIPQCPTPPTLSPTPTPTPPTPNCTPTASEPYCINPAVDDSRMMVAHVLYQEGGSIFGAQGMRNIAQVIRNRIGDSEFADSVIGVISQGNGTHFNGWTAPSARAGTYWPDALATADLLLGGNALSASQGVDNSTVQYFYSCGPSSQEAPADPNHIPYYDEGGGRTQYYFDHLPDPLGCAQVTPTPSPTP